MTEICRLTLRPGDILVVHTPNLLTDMERGKMEDELKKMLALNGLKNNVWTFHGGVRLSLLSPEPA